MRDLFTGFVHTGRFGQVAPYQRFAYVCAGLLVISGLVHGGVYLVDGGPWQGPVSWRKPIVFGLSFGITLATLGWIVGLLRPGNKAGWALLAVASVASVGEVFLISMQRWRGVESHFNEDTPFDGMVFSMMGMLVTVIAVMVVVVTVWSFVRLDAPAGLALAVRAGLVLMLASQAVGVQMIAVQGNTFGAAGLLKVPHAITLHAVQVLPAVALALLVSGAVERHVVRVVAWATVGYLALVGSSLVQTYAGRGPFDLSLAATVLALIGLALLGTSVVAAVRALGSRLRPSGIVVP